MGSIFNGNILTIIVLILSVIILIRSLGLTMRVRRLEKRYQTFMKGSDAQSLEKTFARKMGQIDRLFESKETHSIEIQELEKKFNIMFSKYGIEKYDAFDDVGGKLSFALAMLNQDNSGIILNAVHSRDNCFLYLKEIVKGESYIMLSQEEVEALRKAVNYRLGEINLNE